MKEQTKKTIIEFILFASIINLPFITITSIVGIDPFIDSFQHPHDYQFLQYIHTDTTTDTTHVIIQKSSHPDFDVASGDNIIYFEEANGFQYGTIDLVSTELQSTIYYIITDEEHFQYQPVFEQQVVGKVISSVGSNIWNTLVLELWDTTITHLNLFSYNT